MSVGKNEISNLDKKAEQLYRSHRLICYIGKSGGKYTLSVGGFESGDRAENIRKRLIKAGLIGEGSFVRYRLSNEVPYLAMSGANSEINKESQDESRAERSMAPTALKDQKGVVKGSSKVKYTKAMPKEIEGSREAVNALLEISVKDNKVILKGKAFWKKTLLSYMDDPPRYVLRLFNTENQSVVDTLYNPQKDIEKLMVRYDPHSKTTSVILNLKGKQDCRLEKNGDKVELSFDNSPVEANSGPKVVLGGTSSNPFSERRVYKGRRVSLEFKDADVRDVISLMSEISGLNFVIDSDVHGSVTLKLKNVPWDQALDIILKMNKLGMIEENGIVRVSTLSNISAEMHAQEEAGRALEQLEPLSTEVIPLSYSEAKDVEDLIQPLLSDRGEVNVVERTNSLVVKDIRSRIDTVLDFIDQIISDIENEDLLKKIKGEVNELMAEFPMFAW
jgi:hypothetical protein